MTTNRPLPPRAPARCALSTGFFTLVSMQVGCGADTMPDDQPDSGTGGASFTAIYEAPTFQMCGGCHAPNAPGKTEGTEATQDWSSRDSAYSTLKNGKASGLIGNFEACNGVALIGPTADQSLLVAALDEDVREKFATPSAPDCTADTISDMTLKLGGQPVPASLLTDLKSWINAGAPDN